MAKTVASKGVIPAARDGLGIGKIILIIIIIIVAAGAGFLYISSQQAVQKALPSFPNSNGTVPQGFAPLTSNSQSQPAAVLSNLSSNSLSKTPQFSISYSGLLGVEGTGALSLFSISSPLYVNYAKYNSSTRLALNATDVSILGDVALMYFSQPNSTYICSNFNTSALSRGVSGLGSLSGGSTIQCSRGSSLGGISLSQLSQFNLSLIQQEGVQTGGSTTVYQSTYQGTPCTYVSGILAAHYSNGTVAGQGAYDACYSDTYYVPLSLSAYLNSTYGSFSISLNETSIFNTVSQSYVQTLPGPVVPT